MLLSVTTIDSQSVHVTWSAPTQPNGVLISYTIIYNINGGSFNNVNIPYNAREVSCSYSGYTVYSCIIIQIQTQTFDITGLAPYQLVTVTITATNGGGTSVDSNEMTGRAGEIGNHL